MTPEQVLETQPGVILAMSENDLAAYLLPLFPAARTPYAGPRPSAAETVLMPNGVKKTIKQINAENALMAQTLRQLGIGR